MRIEPLYDRLIVRRIEEDAVTEGGIVIPDMAKEKPQMGMVIAVGPGRQVDDGSLVRLVVAENDKILFGKYSGSEVKLNKEMVVILREEEVLGIVRD